MIRASGGSHLRACILPILALAAVACQGAPPERPQKVGRVARSYVDTQRISWSGDGPRPLRSTLWFPTDSAAEEEPWLIGSRVLPLFEAGWSVPDAKLSAGGERHPLVVMSHGTGGATAQLSWLGEALAADGYVVAAVNHHGNTAIEEKTPHGFFLWWERAEDLRRLIDRILQDEAFASRVDPRRIGAVGFSLGGYTVLELAGARTDLARLQRYCAGRDEDPSCKLPPEAPFSREDLARHIEGDPRFRASMERQGHSYRDPRVRSVVALAPAAGMALTEASLERISIPSLIVVGDRDTTAPAASNASRVAELVPGARFVLLPGVRHYSFLAQCGALGRLVASYACAEDGDLPRRDIHRRVARLVREFFAATLGAA
jgi:predicted dienelactone hydrolase